MNREQAKTVLPIIQALAEGKTIQYLPWTNTWGDVEQINIAYLEQHPEHFRIKPEPRRFTVMVPKPNHPRGPNFPAELVTADNPRDGFGESWEAVEVVEVEK